MAIAVASLSLPAPAMASHCTINWDGSTSTSWTEPTNWDTGAIPGPSDHVCVPDLVPGPGIEVVHTTAATSIVSLQAVGGVRLASGSLTLTDSAELSAVTQMEILAGTSLGGAATLEVSGSLLWAGGTMTGTGTTRVLDTATITHSTTSGTGLASGRVLELAGTLEMISDHIISSSGSPVPLLHVLPGGVVRRSTTIGEARIDAPFENDGLVDTTTIGTLRLAGGGGAGVATGQFGAAGQPGGVSFGSGTFQLGTGALLAGGVTAGALATLHIPPGQTVTVAAGNTIAGGVTGTGTLEIGGSVVWAGGSMTGAGVTRVLAGATFKHATTGGTGLGDGRLLEVAGTLEMSVDHLIGSSGLGARLHVLAGGVVRRTTTIGEARIDVPVENDGLVETASNGTLRLNGGGGGAGAATGRFGAAGQPGTVLFGSGTFDLGDGARLAGGATVGGLATVNAVPGATVTVAGGNTIAGDLTGTGTVEIAGSVNWAGGSMIGAGVTRVLAGGTLTHATTSGTGLESGRVLEVAGILEMSSDHVIFSGGVPGPQLRVLAGGVLRRSATTGEARIDPLVHNQGLIDALSGTLRASTSLANQGTVAVAAGATLSSSGTFTNFSGTTLTGGTYAIDGTFRFAGANVVTNAATIVLSGPAAAIADQSAVPNNALRNLATNAAGGMLQLRQGRNVTAPGPVSNAGTLTVESGSTFQSGPLTSTGTLGGTGTLRASVTNDGVVAPGLSPGILTVDGDYTQGSAGTLRVELAGTAPGSGYDRLAVTGNAALAGTLAIEAAGGFSPELGTRFDVVTAASRSGQFASVTAGFDAVYEPAAVAIVRGVRAEPTPTPQPTPTPTPTPTPRRLEDLPPPTVGRTVNVEPVEQCRVPGVRDCVVRVKTPSGGFVVLAQAEQIPTRSELDTTSGEVRLLAARDAAGATQLANFYAGRFLVTQRRGRRPVAEMVLTGGSRRGCPRGRRASASAKRRRVRRLWGDGKGRFHTRGTYAAAGVRGTRWLVEDLCDATLVRVARGRVDVRDLVRERTVGLRAGQSYLARATRR